MTSKKPKISIVATLYQSAETIDAFYAQASQAARSKVGDDYEIVFVNDGSPDDSAERAAALVEADNHVVLVDLSRNFGHHKAMMTGLDYAHGDLVFLIDSDLEEDPQWLGSFLEQLENDQADVVYGVQKQRKGGATERFSGEIFYKLLNYVTRLDMPANIVTARLMTRRYVDALLRHREREVFLAGLWHITGFKQVPQVITKASNSATTYTLRRKLSILVNSITSFSNAPLVFIFYFGMIISLLSLVYIGWLVTLRFSTDTPVEGWTTVVASIWLIGGMIISFIGVIGIYMSKVFSETKQRPYTIVRSVHGRPEN
jgi:putative glycosyltransferase